jgi:hypothetical protein
MRRSERAVLDQTERGHTGIEDDVKAPWPTELFGDDD